jgi:type II secretory pathway predicted ATPase ExeA
MLPEAGSRAERITAATSSGMPPNAGSRPDGRTPAAPPGDERPAGGTGSPGMYEEFYGLRERPFTTVPDPQFLYWSEGHQMAFAVLYYGVVTRAPITVITGEIGAGKTTLLRRLLAEIPEEITVGLVSNMKEGRGELLQWVMMALGQEFDGDEPYVTLFRRFQDFVIDAYARGQRVVLIVDEAQNLGAQALEELRMFSNINADKDELLQLILVGQPQLRDLLNRPELAQFALRVSADFHLDPLSREDTAQYIRRRLEIAGAGWQIFPDDVCAMIRDATGGVPRLVNILCDLCLVYGFADNRREIGADLLEEILASTRRRGIFGQFDTIDGQTGGKPRRAGRSG